MDWFAPAPTRGLLKWWVLYQSRGIFLPVTSAGLRWLTWRAATVGGDDRILCMYDDKAGHLMGAESDLGTNLVHTIVLLYLECGVRSDTSVSGGLCGYGHGAQRLPRLAPPSARRPWPPGLPSAPAVPHHPPDCSRRPPGARRALRNRCISPCDASCCGARALTDGL